MDLMIGVERTEIRRRPKARNSSTDKGDAGRSIVAEEGASNAVRRQMRSGGGSGQRRQDAAEGALFPTKSGL